MGNGHALEICNSLVTLSDYKNLYEKQRALHHVIFYTFSTREVTENISWFTTRLRYVYPLYAQPLLTKRSTIPLVYMLTALTNFIRSDAGLS